MLKLTASYSKKVPVPNTEYSSQSYHASVEVEIPDGLAPAELDNRIHATFELVRDSVEQELGGGDRGAASRGGLRSGRRPATQPASDKQLNYLRDIALRRGMTVRQLDDDARSRYGVETFRQLTRSQASRMIDELSGSAGGSGGRAA